MKLEGFGYSVQDMARMICFYRDVLGFGIKEQENPDNASFTKDGTLFLMEGRRNLEIMTQHRFETALGMENYAAVDAAYQHVIIGGGVSVLKPTTEPWGRRMCYIEDPEGNLPEIGAFNPGDA